MSFAEKLRDARKEKGLSQEALAEELKVSRQTVTKWETGLSYPEIKTLILLADKLDRELDWLLKDEKELIGGQDPGKEKEKYKNTESIPDKRSLRKALEQEIITRIIHVMDRLEVCEDIGTVQGTVKVKYTVYDGIVYIETEETEPETGRCLQTFSEMEFQGMEQFLPWLEKALTILFIREEEF